jgi:hypothetical protein
MGEKTGVVVHLDRLPLKYEGLSYTEIWISEAQERMVAAVPPEKLEQARAIFAAENVEATVVGTFTDTKVVLEFSNSQDLDRLAPMGTSCPDHFLRTKISPLVLDLPAATDLSDVSGIRTQLEAAFQNYREHYAAYYEKHKPANSPAMRDPNPVIILWPGVGMFSFAKDKQTSRVAAEFYINAIQVMRGAEAVSSYVSLPLQEAFDIEYWLLEEAKLQRMPKPKALAGGVHNAVTFHAPIMGGGDEGGKNPLALIAAIGLTILTGFVAGGGFAASLGARFAALGGQLQGAADGSDFGMGAELFRHAFHHLKRLFFLPQRHQAARDARQRIGIFRFLLRQRAE